MTTRSLGSFGSYDHALQCPSCGAAGDKRFRDAAPSGPARWQSSDGGMLIAGTLGATCCVRCGAFGLRMRPVTNIIGDLTRRVRTAAADMHAPLEAGEHPRTGARIARPHGDPLHAAVNALQQLLQAEARVRYLRVERDGVTIVPPLPF